MALAVAAAQVDRMVRDAPTKTSPDLIESWDVR